jgi:nitrate reductase gamma subunit
MQAIAFILSYITPYIAVIVFVGGIVWQLVRWQKQSTVPANLSLYPRPASRVNRIWDTLVDMFTFKGLLRVNKPLWAGGFMMHAGLLLLLVGHVRVVTDYYFLWNWLKWGEQQQHQFSAIAGLIAGFLFMIPLVYLLARRWSGPVKWLSTPEDYFILFLLLGIAITGNHMRLVLAVDQHGIRDFMQGLILFKWEPVPGSAGFSFIYHFALVQLLMIYFPFSKLLHTIGVLFSKLVTRI